jgi:hypothetical protein
LSSSALNMWRTIALCPLMISVSIGLLVYVSIIGQNTPPHKEQCAGSSSVLLKEFFRRLLSANLVLVPFGCGVAKAFIPPRVWSYIRILRGPVIPFLCVRKIDIHSHKSLIRKPRLTLNSFKYSSTIVIINITSRGTIYCLRICRKSE